VRRTEVPATPCPAAPTLEKNIENAQMTQRQVVQETAPNAPLCRQAEPPLTLLGQVTRRIRSPRRKREATEMEPSGFSPQTPEWPAESSIQLANA
jgi:hypothetical protein